VIRFPIFGVPVTVKPSFWLIALLLGFDSRIPAGRLAQFLAMWVVVVFVSVLAHELGHALVARRLGAETAVTLFFLGGYTTWESSRPMRPAARVAVAAAGSAVGFALGGIVWLALRFQLLDPDPGLLRVGLGLFVAVNVFWGVLNWLPIRPLDGGHIFSGLLEIVAPRRGRRIADVLFPVATLAAGLWALSEGFLFASLLAAFVLMDEVRRWTGPRAQPAEGFTLFGSEESAEER